MGQGNTPGVPILSRFNQGLIDEAEWEKLRKTLHTYEVKGSPDSSKILHGERSVGLFLNEET